MANGDTINASSNGDMGDMEMKEPTYRDYIEYELSQALFTWLSPVLLTLGTVGGILTILVMRQKSIRTASSSIYFQTLAVVDMLVLYIGLMRHYLRVSIDVDIRKLSNWGCKLHYCSLYSLTHYSAWILVILSIERFISVTLPLKARIICSQQNARIYLVVLFIIILGFNSHFFWTRGMKIKVSGNDTSVNICTVTSSDYYDFDDFVWPWIDFSLLSFVPATVMVFCNIGIVTTIYLARGKLAPRIANGNQPKMTTMTAMLLLTNTTFLLLTGPVVVFVIADRSWRKSPHSEHQEAIFYLAYSYVLLLDYLNHAINFILYCIGGPRFRRELKLMLSVNRRVHPQQNTLTIPIQRINCNETRPINQHM